MAMVLVALLGGGDYAPEGLTGFGKLNAYLESCQVLNHSGPTITSALAHAGLSDFLKSYLTSPTAFQTELSFIRGRMVEELRTNSTNQIGRKYPQRAAELASRDIPSLFPTFTLDAYLRPSTSPLSDLTQGWPGFNRGAETSKRGMARSAGRGDLEGMAKACEKYFEWGTRDLVSRKFAGESVGLFGAEIMNEARERVRSASRKTRGLSLVQPCPASPSSSPPRITSFFSSAVPFASTSKSASLSSSTPSSYPLHIVKIHSLRDDPTNPELREYRIAYKSQGYIARCHIAMEGSRVDPKDLSLEQRQALGLVDRNEGVDDTGICGSQAQKSSSSKAEVRVWVSEYLVQEAWPDLIEEYEEEIRIKAARRIKVRAPRKAAVVKPRTSRRAAKVVTNENTGAFVEFFTQRPRQSSSPIEEVEEIEERRPSRRSNSIIDLSLSPSAPPSPRQQKSPSLPELSRKLVRPCPSSSLSSLESEKAHRDLSVPGRIVSSLSPAPRPKGKPNTKVARIISSPKSSPMPMVVRAMSTSSAALAISSTRGHKEEPIDLVSSDEEHPRSSITKSYPPPVSPSPFPFSSPIGPRTVVSRQTRKSKTAVMTTSQTRLSLPAVTVTTTRMTVKGKPSFLDNPIWEA